MCFPCQGRKRYDIPWKDLERSGWIAEAKCAEVRVPMPFSIREKYIYSSERDKIVLLPKIRKKPFGAKNSNEA